MQVPRDASASLVLPMSPKLTSSPPPVVSPPAATNSMTQLPLRTFLLTALYTHIQQTQLVTGWLCCSPAEGGGGGGDTFDDGGDDACDTAGWIDTASSPQQTFQTQGTSAAQTSEASQVSFASPLAYCLLQDELEDTQSRIL